MSTIVRSPEAQAAFDASTRARDEAKYQSENACRLLRHAISCLDIGESIVAADEARHAYPAPGSQTILAEFAQATTEIEAIARRLEGAE